MLKETSRAARFSSDIFTSENRLLALRRSTRVEHAFFDGSFAGQIAFHAVVEVEAGDIHAAVIGDDDGNVAQAGKVARLVRMPALRVGGHCDIRFGNLAGVFDAVELREQCRALILLVMKIDVGVNHSHDQGDRCADRKEGLPCNRGFLWSGEARVKKVDRHRRLRRFPRRPAQPPPRIAAFRQATHRRPGH